MRKKLSFKPLLQIISLTCLFFTFFVLVDNFFQITIIQIESKIPNIDVKGLVNFPGRNLIFLNQNSFRDSLLKNNPELEIEELSRIYPDKLILKIKTVDAVAAFKLNQGYALLAPSGKILSKGKSSKNLTVINYYQNFDYYQFVPGNNLDFEEIALTLYLLSVSKDLFLQVKSVDISSLNMILFNLNEEKLMFSAEKDRNKQAYELETLIRQFRIEAKKYKVLDFRFDKPIVKF